MQSIETINNEAIYDEFICDEDDTEFVERGSYKYDVRYVPDVRRQIVCGNQMYKNLLNFMEMPYTTDDCYSQSCCVSRYVMEHEDVEDEYYEQFVRIHGKPTNPSQEILPVYHLNHDQMILFNRKIADFEGPLRTCITDQDLDDEDREYRRIRDKILYGPAIMSLSMEELLEFISS